MASLSSSLFETGILQFRESDPAWHEPAEAVGERPAYIPSITRAILDIIPGFQGGSQTSSTFASETPSTDITTRSTSPGSVPATGQAGAVSVIVTWTEPPLATLIE